MSKLHSFTQCYRAFSDLPSVNNDPLSQTTVADLVFAAQFEIDLFNEGESQLTAKQLVPIQRFVKKFTS